MAAIKQLFFANKIRATLTILTLLVAIYTIAGFLIVPWVARTKIEEIVSELTSRETSLGKLQLNPFTFSGTVKAFTMTDLDGDTLLSFDRAHANVELSSFIFGGEIHFSELDLTTPYFRFQVNQDGSFNITDIVNQITAMGTEKQETESDPRQLQIDLLKVSDGSISVTDLSLSAPFTSVIAPITFNMTGFHTSGVDDAPYAFSATSESGESFTSEGYVALEPLRSAGNFEVKGFSMPKYEPYNDIVLETDIVGGIIGVTGSYEYNSGASGIMQLKNAGVRIEKVEIVKASDKSAVMSLTSGDISGINADYLAQTIEVDSVSLKEGSFFAKRLADGQIDVMALLKESAMSALEDDPTSPVDSTPAPTYHVKEVVLDNFSIQFTDEAAPIPTELALDEVSLVVTDIKSEPESKLGLLFGAKIRSGGMIAVDGSVSIQPAVEGTFAINLNEIALEVGNAYIPEFADIQLHSGNLTVSGNSSITLAGDTPSGNFAGDVGLTNLNVVETDLGQELVSLTAMKIAGIEAELDPIAVKIAGITLTDPRATVLINEDGTINLKQALRIQEVPPAKDSVAKETAEAETIEEEPSATGLPFSISIGSITLENVGATLTDRSISPAVNLGLETLSGTISGLSSEELARADLDLIGTLTGGTQMAITGKINPLIEDRYSDVEMSFKGFNLTAVSPYSRKYAGYALDKGKLSFDLEYKISHSELTGENLMIIDQLSLGEKVESEDAMNLPIPLAVSLMKDRDGLIEIDVPVSGNLNDPEFGLGRVIGRAVVNIITKLITSPFSMLGGLIPGGADVDLSQVSFIPAATGFDDDITKTLKLLADALAERPTLSIEIVGGAGGPAEVNQLKVEKLEEKLKIIRWKELQEAGNSTVKPEEIALTEADRNRLITKTFNQLFPGEAVTAVTNEAPAKEVKETNSKPTPSPDTETTVTESPSDETEEPKGITGFFKRLFSEGTKESEPQPVEQPVEVTEAIQEVAEEDAASSSEILEIAPSLTVAQMQNRILDTIEVSSENLSQLASNRAEAVRAFLETDGGIEASRLFVIAPEDPAGSSAEVGEPKVKFNLE